MKVHSSLRKRPLVLIEILVCMGVLSHSSNQANAIHLNQLAAQGLFANHRIDLESLLNLQDDAQAEPADQQQAQTENNEAAAQTEGQATTE